LTKAIKIGAQGLIGEVLLPQARDQEVDLQRGMGIDALAKPSLPNPDEYPEEEREFNRYTLLGEYDDLFVALLKERCQHDGVDLIRAPDYFRAHVNRGVILLQACVRSLGDIAVLLPRTDLSVAAESVDEA